MHSMAWGKYILTPQSDQRILQESTNWKLSEQQYVSTHSQYILIQVGKLLSDKSFRHPCAQCQRQGP